jgi:hypothetical protein
MIKYSYGIYETNYNVIQTTQQQPSTQPALASSEICYCCFVIVEFFAAAVQHQLQGTNNVMVTKYI